jgi:NAD(P) transhydrogenase subunit alpha
MPDITNSLFVFMLAGFIGFEVIRRVSPLLHTPLMSITNALDAIAVVGAIVLAGNAHSRMAQILGRFMVEEVRLFQTLVFTHKQMKMEMSPKH